MEHIDEVKSGSSALIDPQVAETAASARRVREISRSADPVTRTYQVRTSMGIAGVVRLGMSVIVTLPRVGGSAQCGTALHRLVSAGPHARRVDRHGNVSRRAAAGQSSASTRSRVHRAGP